MHMYLIRAVKACLRVAYPSAHSTGIFTIHPFGIHSILAVVAFDCGSLKPHGKRQVNASFLILLPQHLYVSALPQNDTLIRLSKDSINFYNLQIIRDKNEY